MSERWWEIVVLCAPILEESVYWRLDKFGCSGSATQVREDGYAIRAYIPHLVAQTLDIAALSLWLKQDAMMLEADEPEVTWHLIDEEDWGSSWKQHWHPTEIGDRFLIYPAWLDFPEAPDRIVLRLDPGAAFGTGTHPTTQLCLESLEMRLYEQPETQTIADIGCGSGILAIGAALLKAKQVHAVDTDLLSTKTCRSNCQLNEIDRGKLIVHDGSIEQLIAIEQKFDGVICNILAETIIELFPQFESITHAKSWAVLSGILLTQADSIADVVEGNGWTVAALWKRQDWCCFNVRRSEY
jgi:ribosomal protein L11 methyltransferase